jgi:hypothetical protein
MKIAIAGTGYAYALANLDREAVLERLEEAVHMVIHAQ